uniref:non-specific serine/threonine protein kinase n=1 Tax=Trypanosoma congolense (strain IL3000) TaxID=1068625 RepID=G0V2Y1_TRYCI|nr:unnamed protein product [Trypanosoma congolense IL3000]
MGNGTGRSCTRSKSVLSPPSNGLQTSYTASDLINNEDWSQSGPIPLINNGSSDVGKLSLGDILGETSSSTALYWKKKLVGEGAFGEAFIVERNRACRMYGNTIQSSCEAASSGRKRDFDCMPMQLVAKVVNLTCMTEGDRQYAQTEIMCLANTRHFAIVQYVEHFFVEDDETIVIITEFAERGDMHRYIHSMQGDLHLSEKEAGILFVQLLLGLDHIHRRRMIHRDIKSANIFLTSLGLLKVGDFGFSKQYDSTVSNPIALTFVGTSYYLSPEMLKGQRYGKKADIWAAGIVLCELLGRRRPFEAHSLAKLKELVLAGDMWLPPTSTAECFVSEGENPSEKSARYITREMREFLQSILQVDPDRRPSASQLLKTPLMQHYLQLFKVRVQQMISADDELEAKYFANPAQFDEAPPEYNLTAWERTLLLQGISDGEDVITLETEKEMRNGAFGRMEGVVFKGVQGGLWKERYLILADGFLTVTLVKGRSAAGTGDRSRKLPLDTIKSVAPMNYYHPSWAEGKDELGEQKEKHAFVLSTLQSQSIVLATETEAERDRWLTSLMESLKMV